METDAGAQGARGNRPRPVLLIFLGVVVVAFVMMKLGGSAGPRTTPPANASRSAAQAALADSTPAAGRGRGHAVDPRSLDVHLEALASQKPVSATTERNPFRFRPAPAPPPPPPSKMAPGPPVNAPPVNTGPPPPPPPPPITVKFIGLIERADGTKLAVFTDCTAGRRQSQAKEGGVVDGRYRLVKIGLQSVIIEHLDGRGRTTLAQGGQECVK